jgi:tRNA 5-methylaminomethyl-2-thiouridine biosynthesis bifunctional protein
MTAPLIPSILLNPHYDDRYFDVLDGFEEAKYIHVQGNRILERLAALSPPQRTLSIAETGFGAARTLAALIDTLNHAPLSDTTIDYYSVELHPLAPTQMQAILHQVKGCDTALVSDIVEQYATVALDNHGWQRFCISQPFGTIAVQLWIGEALEMVTALPQPVDAWFLDGHGPKKNPAMWRSELLMAIGSKTAAGGSATSFTVAGHIRRDLAQAGFNVVRREGMGAKKSVLQAFYP